MTPHVAAQVTAEVTAPACAEAASAGRQVAAFCRTPRSAKEIMAEPGLKHWKTFQANYLAPLMAMGVLERTIPDKPRSRMQRYRTTEAGLAILRTHQVSPSSASRQAPMPRGTRG